MKKILIEVVCAATAKSYEFLLPAQMSVGVARKKIIAVSYTHLTLPTN